MDFKTIVETYRAHKVGIWSDSAELNYWARKIGFQKLTTGYRLVETNFFDRLIQKIKRFFI